jgi:endonuclease V-like protein UPF0215 family
MKYFDLYKAKNRYQKAAKKRRILKKWEKRHKKITKKRTIMFNVGLDSVYSETAIFKTDFIEGTWLSNAAALSVAKEVYEK